LVAATEQLRKQNGGELPHGVSKAADASGKPNVQLWVNGQLHTWHHSYKKGRMELIPTELHNQSIKDVGPHIGHALWWKIL
jgi:hypothetical protein